VSRRLSRAFSRRLCGAQRREIGVRALSTEPARFQSWLDVEAALAGRRPSWAFIPEAAGHDIDRKAHVKYLDRGDRGLTDGGGRTWHGA